MRLITLLIACILAQMAKGQSPPAVYYVGNMGVAIVKNDSVVLIDALHDYYNVYYLPSDPAILKKLGNKEEPFVKVIAIIATHLHNDHFDDTLISQMSHQLPGAKVVMGKQPAEKLTGVAKEVLTRVDQSGTVKLANHLSITLTNIGHVGNRHKSIENYRIEVTWGPYRFVHLGDAAPDAKSLEGLLPGADVAVVPHWFCYDAQDIQLLESKKFKRIIATHIDPKSKDTPFGKSTVEIIPFKTYGQKYVLK